MTTIMATLNIQRGRRQSSHAGGHHGGPGVPGQLSGGAGVMLANIMKDRAFPLVFLAVQELDLDLPQNSAESFVDIFRRRGLRVFLSVPDNAVYRRAVLAWSSGAAVDLGLGRVAGACFEFLCKGNFIL